MTRDGSSDDTLPDPALSTSPTQTRTRAIPAALAGYELGAVIGRGGMGEVLLAHDRRLGRDVAIKRMLTADPTDELLARFLREAQIQARLDHPAIVPVHELGYDAEGRPFFTMKRLAGTTLYDVLAAGDATPQRLLRAFADACLAIELAHTKEIVHRDLKPSNIMLGDYGEVYVLDWGVARVIAETSEPDRAAKIPTFDGATAAGALLGTPGYMAPEQAAGELVGRAADVYSLGCILFEILTGEPLHPRGPAGLAATIEGTVDAPSQRRPDRAIAPELDAACAAALARDPARRPTARALADRIQRYLDGDRDLERRRSLAAEQLARAQAAFAARDRALAMRTAGHALALDPESADAAELVTRLMLEPPTTPPPALRRELEDAEATAVSRHARNTVFAYLCFVGFLPIVMWNGVLSWPLIAAVMGMAVVMSGSAFVIARQPRRSRREMTVYLLGNVSLLALVDRVAGPLLIAPALACMVIMAAIFYPVFSGRLRFLVGMVLAGWLLPVGLECAGLVAKSWDIVDGEIIARSQAIHIGGIPTTVFVFGASLVTIAVAAIHAGVLSRSNLDAQRKLVTQAWHLRQLLPVDTP